MLLTRSAATVRPLHEITVLAWSSASGNPNHLRLAPEPVTRSEVSIIDADVDHPSTASSSLARKCYVGASGRQLGATALLLGLALWHIKGLRKTDTFIVPT